MKAKITWVLIADQNRAKVFKYEGQVAGLSAVRDLMVDDDTLTAEEVTAQADPVGSRAVRFIKVIAERLEEKYRMGAFEQLMIAAAPDTLGEIRSYLSKALQAVVIAELPKELTRMPTPEIESHIVPMLAPPASALSNDK